MRPMFTAEWRNLILLTYVVDSSFLEEYLPKGLELDTFKGRTFVSFVAFEFKSATMRGFPIPFYRDFPVVNLRFYVRRPLATGGYERGVVFLKELVPKKTIAWMANRLYNEKYVTTPMSCSSESEHGQLVIEHQLEWERQDYRWRFRVNPISSMPAEGTSFDFFKEHHWGFGRNKRGELIRYRVEHEPWKVFNIEERFYLHLDFAHLFGDEWAFLNTQIPFNIMVAEGSPVKVYPAQRI